MPRSYGTKLSDAARAFVVQRLAMYDTPQQVADQVRETFGVEIDRRSVLHYDPTRPGADVAKKWRALFQETRAAFLAEKVKVPVAHRAVRLAMLGDMAGKAHARGSFGLAAQLLEQAAKESGDAYTNVRRLDVRDPADALAALLGLDPAEVRALADAPDADPAGAAPAPPPAP